MPPSLTEPKTSMKKKPEKVISFLLVPRTPHTILVKLAGIGQFYKECFALRVKKKVCIVSKFGIHKKYTPKICLIQH